MEPIVHYSNETGADLYAQFDDEDNTTISLTEGEDQPRRYAITAEEIADAGIQRGFYNVSIRVGLGGDYADDADQIIAVQELDWSGVNRLRNDSGGGILSARIGIVSLTSSDFLDVVQGEEKSITFIVEAHGRFITDVFEAIVVKMQDADGTTITKTEEDNSIVRVCEALDVQVIRCVLSEEDTESLVAGLLQIELAFDSQKARLTHSLRIIDQILVES